MTAPTPLHGALLELGLEDLIPLPEALGDQDVRASVGGQPTINQIAAALVELLHLGRVSVWAGRWPAEPHRVSSADAERLLSDPGCYSFSNEAKGLERIYFANVENIA
ncbi:hypothetical protein [Amycolatopsis sp. GM8]|uniref:hypothetical protein n=1 Tax=Amycolatopsis sp. GM8 TaxID=2896530 RepID=UPI001F2634CB|nr:hypothetical protein [Amycolatopsis sp. GM8]